MRLTDTSIRTIKLPADKTDHIEWDEKLPGFGLRLRGSARTWIAQSRLHGKTVRIKLGTADKMDAEAARRLAKQALGQIEEGINPHAVRQEARDKAAETFGAVAKLYLTHARARLKPRSMKEVTRHIGKHLACFDGELIHAINRRQVSLRLAEIAEDSGPAAANRVRATLSALFGWAMREGIVDTNPVIGTNKATKSGARERVLTDAELAAIWAACRDDDHGRIVKLLMLTGQRRDEVGAVTWDEIDLNREIWNLPAERSKNHRAHSIPLSPAAVAILQSMPRRVRNGAPDCVFGKSGRRFSGWSKAKAALDRRIREPAPWRLHDLRRTAATVMADRLGVLPHVVEAVLNHVSGHKAGVAGVYNRARYEAEMRDALNRWDEYLQSIVGGTVR